MTRNAIRLFYRIERAPIALNEFQMDAAHELYSRNLITIKSKVATLTFDGHQLYHEAGQSRRCKQGLTRSDT